MSTRGRYRTKQQQVIVDYLSQCQNTAMTVEAVGDGLRRSGISVGQTTIYRALDRLCEIGVAIKVPAVLGNQARYRYVGESAQPDSGKLVCLKCGRTYLLECGHLEELTRHINADHEFEIDSRHTVLYGYCRDCRPQD